VLEAQLDAIANAVSNLRGLVAKTARIQSEFSEAGFNDYAEAVGGSFSSLSSAIDGLEEAGHDLEIERIRRQSSG